MPQTPAMNLPPAATPWGRAMQGKIEELERSAARRTQAETNANQGQNGTLTSLAKQIVTLNAALETLVKPSVFHVSVDSFPITDVQSATPLAPYSIPVPDGYASALIFATATLTVLNSTTTDTSVDVAIGITGQDDEHGGTHGSAPAGLIGGASDSYSWLITGLGTTIDIGAYGYVSDGSFAASMLNQASVSGMAVFIH